MHVPASTARSPWLGSAPGASLPGDRSESHVANIHVSGIRANGKIRKVHWAHIAGRQPGFWLARRTFYALPEMAI